MTSIKIKFSEDDVVPQQVLKSQNASHIVCLGARGIIGIAALIIISLKCYRCGVDLPPFVDHKTVYSSSIQYLRLTLDSSISATTRNYRTPKLCFQKRFFKFGKAFFVV